jgi:hypothetical protein
MRISQGTADLALRIGLNSGPTTAGVLRGEKSRFQLFGDVSSARSITLHSHIVTHIDVYCRRSTLLPEWKAMESAIAFTCQRRLLSALWEPVKGMCSVSCCRSVIAPLDHLTLLFRPSCRHWLRRRDEQLTYKGKGVMTTYWCEPIARTEKESIATSHQEQEADEDNTSTLNV